VVLQLWLSDEPAPARDKFAAAANLQTPMPDSRTHRGPHPQDGELFSPAALPRLRDAVADLSWLLSRGYALPGALQVVGNRYDLESRQRQAVTRSACTDEAMMRRRSSEVPAGLLRGATLRIDGYNVLTTVEAALGGAAVLLGRDGSLRDIAGVHGTYRRVEETLPALQCVGSYLKSIAVGRCEWYLDAPVSNSGRLKAIVESAARDAAWDWTVHVVPNPDAVLSATSDVVATADSVILDRCPRWFALAREVVAASAPGARLVDLRA
jgi:hypothetical protein